MNPNLYAEKNKLYIFKFTFRISMAPWLTPNPNGAKTEIYSKGNLRLADTPHASSIQIHIQLQRTPKFRFGCNLENIFESDYQFESMLISAEL